MKKYNSQLFTYIGMFIRRFELTVYYGNNFLDFGDEVVKL